MDGEASSLSLVIHQVAFGIFKLGEINLVYGNKQSQFTLTAARFAEAQTTLQALGFLFLFIFILGKVSWALHIGP